MSKKILVAAVLACAAGAANAQTYPGAGFPINDNVPNSGTIIAAGAPVSLTGVEVTIFGLTHTFMSDLNAFLTAPNGDILTLFDNTGGGGNPNGNFNFTDSAAAVVTGADLLGGSFLAQGGTFLGTFGGDNGNGTWTLNINDEAGIDVGGITGWELRLSPVPAPGAAALLGLGVLVGNRRRRA